MMLKRKAMEKLIDWKNQNRKKAMIVSGARQVGKTYIVREFGKAHYDSFIELNFIENPSLAAVFAGSLGAQEIIDGIRLYIPGSSFIEHRTLLFLDEIQDCPNAITALKFLASDNRFDIIASGSALGMVYNRVTSYPVGSTDYLDMTSLDYEEFLWAAGIPEDIAGSLREYVKGDRKVPDAIHERMLYLLKQYMVIGGMPEVVSGFVESGDYQAADSVQRRIYRDYLADIARYADPNIKIKAENCYKSIPFQLSKDNHKFQYGIVEKKGTSRKFESSVDWIINAGMAIFVKNVGFVEYPLSAHVLNSNFRLYPNDIGLLICTYDFGLKAALMGDGPAADPRENIVLRTAKGGIYEALAADLLYKAGHRNLFFYRNEQGTAEIEFLMENSAGVVPIEIKAGNTRTKSLDNLLKKDDIQYGYKLASANAGRSGKKITLPVYMAAFI